MKATDLLRQQHREVEELFRQIQSAEDEEERSSLREELANALAAHTAIEEEIFYPAAMEAIGSSARVREALEEHAIADFALYRFMNVSPSDETFSAKLGALKDVVMDHVEEEESELLPQAEGEMAREQLDMLGERLSSRFEERMMEGHRAILARSLGIAARQVAHTAPGAKKAAAPRRAAGKRAAAPAKRAAAPAKRGAASTKRGAAAAKRGGTTKRAGAAQHGGTTQAAQKRNGGAATEKRGQTGARKASAQKTAARGRGVSRTQSQSNTTRAGAGARGGQTAQKGMARGGQTRASAGGARKQRAGR